MTKNYATSVYSQKSTTSAKSGRSYFSFTTGATIRPIFATKYDDDDLDQDGSPPDSLTEQKHSIWKNLKKKTWMYSTKKDEQDNKSSSTDPSEGGKWKKFLVSPTQYMGRFRDNQKSPVTSIQEIEPVSEIESLDKPSQRHFGILVNAGCGSAKEIAEQNKRRTERRLYLMRLQQPTHRQSSKGSLDTKQRQVGFSDSSSSSTVLSTPDDTTTLNEEEEWYSAAPRVMFVEPSPVPRFRNAPPAPPPSPPYLSITAFEGLTFKSPLSQGQSLTFTLQNTIPDDHIIIYKFLTSNSRLVPRRTSKSTTHSTASWPTMVSGTPTTSPERYFVRPSAGMIVAAHADIRLCLNKIPPFDPGDTLKDKIMVRWAVIQRGTLADAWAQKLKGSTRRKWLEMLLEEWPDQVVERKTRISIRFV